MDSSQFIAIYMPIFILLFVILPSQNQFKQAFIISRRKRRVKGMNNELLLKFKGRECKISTGSFGVNVVGTIVDIKDNWVEVETKKGIELLNVEFIQSIKSK